MRRILLSFASRLTFYILTLTTLIFLCIAIVFHRYSRLREERQAVEYTSVLQEKLIQKVDFELEEVENTVRSEVYRVKRLKETPDEMMPIVKGMVKGDSLIMGGSIAFVRNYYEDKGERFMEYAYIDESVNGSQKLVTKHLGDSAYNYLSMPWFTEALAQGKGVWSDPYFDKGGGNQMMITYSYPIQDENNHIFAIITADVSLEDLSLNMFTIRPYPDSYSFIISRSGTYISHPDKNVIMRSSIFSRATELNNNELINYGHKMLAGERGTFRSNLNGDEVLACYAPLTRTGWSICSICPYNTVMAQLGSTFGVVALILLCGLVMLSLCIRILVKFTVKPIKQLTEATYQISKGNFECQLPKINTKDDLSMLHDAFENMQQSLLNYIQQLKSTTQQKERIESELTIAHDIQMSIVPKKFSPFEGCGNLELYAQLKPAKEVGGDLYDFFIRNDKLFFCVGDVSGKGIPASLVMAITSTLFRMTANSYDEPDIIVTKLNDTISDNNEANMFVTMFVGVLDLKSGKLTYCNAGHNPPILFPKENKSEYLSVKANLPLGIMKGMVYSKQDVLLQKNQALFIYTDGLTEAENQQQEQFGDVRTLEIVNQYADCEVKDMITNIQNDLARFTNGVGQSDDLTMLCVRLNSENENKEKTIYKELVIDNELSESTKLAPFIESISDELQWSSSLEMSLNLALEEALVNAIQYAYPQDIKGKIVLKAWWKEKGQSSVTFELIDEGIAFDPTKVKEADVSLGIDERPIGGLGIFLTRKIMDEMTYKRENEKNILIMVKNTKDKQNH